MQITIDVTLPAGVTEAQFRARAARAHGHDPRSESTADEYISHALLTHLNTLYIQGVRMETRDQEAVVEPPRPKGPPENVPAVTPPGRA